MCTVDASVFDEFHLKFGQYLDEPLLFGRHFSPARRSLSTDFLSPRALTPVSARGLWGCWSRQAHHTGDELMSISLRDCCIVITVVTIHTVEHVSQTTTTTNNNNNTEWQVSGLSRFFEALILASPERRG